MIGRTHYCGKLREEQVNEKVQLKGWVQRRRDLGQVIFLDLRDRTGIVQVVCSPEIDESALQIADRIRNEYVIAIEGTVVKREEETVNPNLQTGTIEVHAHAVSILNRAKAIPFPIEENTDASEDVRLKYRYLDLRRPDMQEVFKLRHETTKVIRNFLDEQSFMEIETPMLTKSTPEGARDYLVPSRVHEGAFYALPQSPQLFKQLLMVSGFERYYQIARCFRDEDLRADRQPEFTQVDIEASFMDKEELLSMVEQMMATLMKEIKGVDIPLPFPRITYEDAMNRFGSDKPDMRFGMELVELSEVVKDTSFNVFKQALANGGIVKGLNLKGGSSKLTRREIDGLTDFVKDYGAKGLAWLRVDEDGVTGPIARFFEGEEGETLQAAMGAEAGDLLLFSADKKNVVYDSLGALRLKFGKEFDLIDTSQYNFVWVVDFPLVEYDEDEKRFVALHHPFTRPREEDVELLETEPEKVLADAYDLVLNGYELGGGSQRIYERDMQEKMFSILGFTEEKAKEQFGFLLDAFEYGTPPHGGIAFGLDRIVMLLADRTNLRDTIAFPKTASASDLLTDAPGEATSEQLLELHLAVMKKKKQNN